jgi:acylphosphatase
MERKRIHVQGQLRGTGYGSGGWRKAHALTLGGFMDKQRDGSFIFEVEGRPEDVAAFVEWAERGSPRSVVDSVEVTVIDPTGETVFLKAGREGDDSGDEEAPADAAAQLAHRAARKAERKAERRARRDSGE